MQDPTSDASSPPVLVTGGTGTLGRLVVARLLDAGRDVRVLSRGRRSRDPATGDAPAEARIEFVTADLAGASSDPSLEAAMAGVEVVVHLAGSAKGDADKARNLVRAAKRTGVRHLVYISVVGADRVPAAAGLDRAMFGYFGAKLAAEQVIAASGLAWTTLRATQFYDLTLKTAQQLAKLPLMPVPSGFTFQPIDAADVAARLVELALGAPAGLVPDMAGPRVYEMADLVRGYLRAAHRHRLIVPLWLPGRAARAIRAGATLSPARAVGRRTWEDFLVERVTSTGAARQPSPV